MEKLAIPMNVIDAYSLAHITIVAGIIIISILLALLVNRLKLAKSTVLVLTGIVLLLFEILKQFLLTYVRGGYYSWSDFPFQLCSTPMYLCLIYPFAKRLRSTIEDFIMVFGPIGAIASFVVPYSSFYNYLLLTIQSLVWHGLLLFLGIYLYATNRQKKVFSSYKPAGALYLVLSFIAVILNIAFYRVSYGEANMFFLGPGYPQITVLDIIYERLGWIVETFIMIFASCLAGYILFRLCSLFSKSIKKRPFN